LTIMSRAVPAASRRSRRALGTVWVDIPQGPPFLYTPTAAMVDALAKEGLPGLVAAVMRARPQGWQGTSLWDDLAALYLLRPDVFRRVSAHHEPAVRQRDA
jgi:hypothetical protein